MGFRVWGLGFSILVLRCLGAEVFIAQSCTTAPARKKKKKKKWEKKEKKCSTKNRCQIDRFSGGGGGGGSDLRVASTEEVVFVACEISQSGAHPHRLFRSKWIRRMGCCVKKVEAVVRVLQVQSSCPPSDGHHERFINWLPPFLFAVLAHNVDHKYHARTSAMQGH